MMTRTDFTRRALHAAISGTRYAKLHIASPILLGVEPIDAFFIANDGLVTVASLLAALDARSDPLDLLVLSAADLRPWSSRASDIAMLVAGDNLRSVVVSLWPAPTDSRMDLLTEMYRRLASGDSKAPSAHAWRARPTRRVGRRCSWWGTCNDKGSRRQIYRRHCLRCLDSGVGGPAAQKRGWRLPGSSSPAQPFSLNARSMLQPHPCAGRLKRDRWVRNGSWKCSRQSISSMPMRDTLAVEQSCPSRIWRTGNCKLTS